MTTDKLDSAELLYNCAETMGLRPLWIKVNNTFAITIAGKERYIHGSRSPLNTHADFSVIVDKHLTRLILERHGMPNIPFTKVTTLAEAEAFLQTHGKIIAKPVRGYGSIDIHIVTDAAQFDALNLRKYILEKYIAGREMRYIVLNGKIIAVHESKYGVSVEADRELERISFPESEWDPVLSDLSIEAARVFNLTFGVVDYMVDADGRAHILELNTAPGLKWIHSPTSGPVVDIARLFLEAILEEHEGAATLDDDTVLAAASVLAYS